MSKCVRSGFCCKQATCVMGVTRGAAPEGCKFLVGTGPGDYSCQVILDNPQLKEAVAIGGGCSSTLFNNDRVIALRRSLRIPTR